MVRAAQGRGYAKEAARSLVAMLQESGWTVAAHIHPGHLRLTRADWRLCLPARLAGTGGLPHDDAQAVAGADEGHQPGELIAAVVLGGVGPGLIGNAVGGIGDAGATPSGLPTDLELHNRAICSGSGTDSVCRAVGDVGDDGCGQAQVMPGGGGCGMVPQRPVDLP